MTRGGAPAGSPRRLPDGVELVPAGGLVEQPARGEGRGRDRRDARGRRASATAAYESLRERGLAGRTEREVAVELVRFMEDQGAERARRSRRSWRAAAHGALPHAVPRDVEIPRDTLVVIDMGARVDGYCSDCTRTLATGSLTDEMRRGLRAGAARAGARRWPPTTAGAECRAVDAVAREIIDAAGHGEHFGHGLGHGVGLEVHEGPRLGKTAEGALAAGNAVTVEPGVYLPGEFGVRIEDLVVVTDGEPRGPHRRSRRTSSRSPDGAGRGRRRSRERSSSPPPGSGSRWCCRRRCSR